MLRPIENVADLLAAVRSGSFSDLSPSDMEMWLPQLAASTSWSTWLSHHFLLLYHAETDVVALDENRFIVDCEDLHAQVTRFFVSKGCEPSPAAARRHLAMLVVHAQTPVTFGSVIGTDTMLYLPDTTQDPQYLDRFRHEISHFVWGSLFGEAPGVLNEGIAVATETLSQPGKSEIDLFNGMPPIDQIPPFSDLCRNEQFFSKGISNYRAVGTLVYFLAGKFGWPRLGQLFRIS